MAVKRSQKTRKTARKTARKTKKAKRSTKQRKRIVKSSNSKHEDLGRLDFQELVVTKREKLQAERGEYEKKYVSRYKESETKPKKSKPSKEHNEDLGRLDFREHVVTRRERLQAERDEYEKKYVARYLQQHKLKQKKKNN